MTFPKTTPRLTRLMAVGFGTAALALGAAALPATASASPECANTTSGSATQCCVKVGDAPGPGPDCTSKQSVGRGLLGTTPVLGNLPGLGGLL
ncbi:hypothetical protein [Mycolicibacterium hodleri]|uniref:hypothetical protein n=1 Tax=Mycolicibacterium hodleri TaxID=49897 RepID=UPI00112A0C5F|nr:hypothetical protein [Mycolicibacterium hodleri]